MERIKYNRLGHCPLCNSRNISYRKYNIFKDYILSHVCYCEDCHASFDEDFEPKFIGYSNVVDNDGIEYIWGDVEVEE